MQLTGGHTLSSAVTIWTAGFSVPDLATRSGLSTDATGRLLTDETLTSMDDARIVAAGDCAAPSELPFRMSCQSATRIGAHAADTVLARIASEQPEPINLGFFGQCISLGCRAGIFQFASKDDTANRYYVGGSPQCEAQGVRLQAHRQASGGRGTQARLAHMVADDKRRQQLEAAMARRCPPAERAPWTGCVQSPPTKRTSQ